MVKVLFVCHGNICRSPMAESVFAQTIAQNHWEGQVAVSSAAARDDAIGWPPHEGTQKKLAREKIPLVPHRARLLTRADAEEYDFIIGMDGYNMRDIKRIVGEGGKARVCKLLDFTPAPRDIDDPWYTGDFDATFRDIVTGCEALSEHLRTAYSLRGGRA